MSEFLTIAMTTADGWVAINDKGVRVQVPASACALRLRPGQRVRADIENDQIVAVRITGFSQLPGLEASWA